MLLLEAGVIAAPRDFDTGLRSFLLAHPPTSWDVARLHGGGGPGGTSARSGVGTAALLLHTSSIVKILHAFSALILTLALTLTLALINLSLPLTPTRHALSVMPVSSHDLMLEMLMRQRKLRVLDSEQRLFYPVMRGARAASPAEKQCGGGSGGEAGGGGGGGGEERGESQSQREGKRGVWARARARAREARAGRDPPRKWRTRAPS